ncbi:MAG: dihydrofolate reductase [Calditrichaeota bacterium]|nr:dihydrofolate reductase [Calditrichota bacterium]
MPRIILNAAMSLDAYIEGPNGEFDWCFTDQDYGMTDFLKSIDYIFYGRKSYELMLRMKEESFRSFKNCVFSKTLKSAEDGWQLIDGPLIEEVQKLQKSTQKNIWLFGGSSLVQSFIETKLLDECILAVHPILLGAGKPLFSLTGRIRLSLINSITYSSGLVQTSNQTVDSCFFICSRNFIFFRTLKSEGFISVETN